MPEEFQEPTSMSADEAADSLLAQLENNQASDEDQDEDQMEAAEVDTEVTDETTDDQTEEAETEEVEDETPSDDEELFFEVDGEEVSLAQMKEWRESGLKSADYTQKTQKLSEDRRVVEADRIAIQQELHSLQSERTQLQDALASLSIDGETEPDWVDLANTLNPQDYQAEQARWNQRQAQKAQAQQAYQALQQQQTAQVQQREIAALLQHKPEWSDPQVFGQRMQEFAPVVAPYGYTPDELSGIMDHRMFRVLDRLAELEAQAVTTQKAKDAVSKRVVKAAVRRKPGAKSSKSETTSKAVKARQSKFKQSRSVDDATDMLMAQLNS